MGSDMGCWFLNNGSFYGYKVSRRISGEYHNRWFSLRPNGHRLTAKQKSQVKQKAEAFDLVLAEQQRQAKKQQPFNAYNPFNARSESPTGIRGLSICYKIYYWNGVRYTYPIIRITIRSFITGRIAGKSFSFGLNRPDYDHVLNKALNHLFRHKRIAPNSKMARMIRQFAPSYRKALQILKAIREKERSAIIYSMEK